MIDCTMYLNETEVFVARLSVLNPVCDRFYVFESPITFSKKPKKLMLRERLIDLLNQGVLTKEVFCKICAVEIPIEVFGTFMKPNATAWDVEEAHRLFMLEHLDNDVMRSNDIVVFSDIDEIPSMNQLVQFANSDLHIANFKSRLFRYFFNLYFQDWKKGIIARWSSLRKVLKQKQKSGQTLMKNLRMKERHLITTDQLGWHFSSVGSMDQIWQKVNSFSHSKEHEEAGKLDKRRVLSRITDRIHLFKDGKKEGVVVSAEGLPTAVSTLEYFYPLLLRED